MIRRLIIKLIGKERIEFIRSRPFVVHGKYRALIEDLEKYSRIIRNNYGTDPNLSLLLVRKYGHIIDKGLHRDDTEPGHSQEIVEALKENLQIVEKYLPDSDQDETIKWALEKLYLYKNLQSTEKCNLSNECMKPVFKYNELLSLIKSRRSNRQFLEKPVEINILERLAEIVNWAPSSCNRQPIKLFATNSPAVAKECLKQCKGGTGFSEFIPCFVAFCADMRGYSLPDEVYLPAIDVSLGVQNFLLATNTFELSATCLSWALKDIEEERKIRSLLRISSYYQIIFHVVVGYASKEYISPIRKSLASTLQISN